MIIKQLNIDHFGKLHHTQIDLNPGINIIYGANESGKSTIHSFIQSMFFGAMRTRGRSSSRDIYSKYAPWSGDGYGGMLRFSYGDRSYRIVRRFGKEAPVFTLLDEDSGQEFVPENGDLSTLIPEFTLTNFRNSISSAQLIAEPDDTFASSMQSYMTNLACGADVDVNVSNALSYLKAERKKISSSISRDDYDTAKEKADSLRSQIAEYDKLSKRHGELSSKKESLKSQLHNLELQTDDTMKSDRKERMKAIQLIQENNDVAAMYREKKAKLKELESANLSLGESARHYHDIINNYSSIMAQIEDIRSRCSELEGDNEGSLLRSLAFSLPFILLAMLTFIVGSFAGLGDTMRYMLSGAFVVIAILMAYALMSFFGRKKKKIKKYQQKEAKLLAAAQAILDKYNISSIDQLSFKTAYGTQNLQLIKSLKEEIAQLRDRYDRLQEPLKPYIEKYGDSITLESDAGQEQKKELERLRRQLIEINRQIEQLEWHMEQARRLQEKLDVLENEMHEMKNGMRTSYEDLAALDVAERVIKKLTAQIHGSSGNDLADQVSSLLSQITDNQHERIIIDENFQIMVDDGRQILKPHQLSLGTQDQIYFAVRAATGNMLFAKPMPLILDESFALYDDNRLANTLTWLASNKSYSQILIFTCQRREIDILTGAGYDCNVIYI